MRSDSAPERYATTLLAQALPCRCQWLCPSKQNAGLALTTAALAVGTTTAALIAPNVAAVIAVARIAIPVRRRTV